MRAGEQPLSDKEYSKAGDGAGGRGSAAEEQAGAEGGGAEGPRIEGCCSLCSSLIDQQVVLCKVTTKHLTTSTASPPQILVQN